MPGHSDIIFVDQMAPNAEHWQVSTPNAHLKLTCSFCKTAMNAAVIAVARAPQVMWVRCTACDKGIVLNDMQMSPAGSAGEDVDGLPTEVNDGYDEARRNASVGSYTSCELMCRKILMHVAVDKGAGTGLTFAAYLDHLQKEGYVTPPMRPWVDLIRQHGNIATHEIPATDSQRALETLAFTTQLLRLVYEMAYKFTQFRPSAPSNGEPIAT